MTPKPDKKKEQTKGLTAPSETRLLTQIDGLDREIHDLGKQLIAEQDLQACHHLQLEIAERIKRKRLFESILRDKANAKTKHFSRFAEFKYGHLTPEETQTIHDLGELLGYSRTEVEQNFNAFVSLMSHQSQQEVLFSAIQRQGQRQNQIQNLEKEVADCRHLLKDHEAALQRTESDHRQQLDQCQDELKVLEEANRRLQHDIQSARELYTDLETQLAESTANLHKIREEALASRRECAEWEDALRACQTQAEDQALKYRQNLDAMTRQANLDQTQLRETEAAFQKACHERDTWSEKFLDLTADHETLGEDLEQTKATLQVSTQNHDELAESLQSFRETTATLEAELTLVHTQLEDARSQLENRQQTKSFHLERIMATFQAQRKRWDDSDRPEFTSEEEQFYGFLIATVWTDINADPDIPKTPRALEQELSKRLDIPHAIQRFSTPAILAAVNDCNAYQRDIYPFAEAVPIEPASSFPELFVQLLTFAAHRQEWSLHAHFQKFLAGKHPEQERLMRWAKSQGIPLSTMSLPVFVTMWQACFAEEELDRRIGEA